MVNKVDFATKDFYPFNHEGARRVKENKCVWLHSSGHLCGYVAIAKNKLPVEWCGNYDSDALQYLNIHGGLTFCEVFEDWVVFGFDCAHAGDSDKPELKSELHIMNLIEIMEQQILVYLDILPKWRKASRKKRIKILDKIRGTAKINSEYGFGANLGMLAGASEFGTEEFKGKKETGD